MEDEEELWNENYTEAVNNKFIDLIVDYMFWYCIRGDSFNKNEVKEKIKKLQKKALEIM